MTTFNASFFFNMVLAVCAIIAFTIILNDFVSGHHVSGTEDQLPFDENNTDVPICCPQFGEGEFWGDTRK